MNNTRLLDYLYLKYNVSSAGELGKAWQQYQQEKEERKEFAEAEAKTEFYQKQLVAKLGNYRVTAPDRWIGQTAAILDKREMVEIRHELILRRQALRKQLDYNNQVGENARKEIMDIVKRYPAYGPEILAMVDKYERISSHHA